MHRDHSTSSKKKRSRVNDCVYKNFSYDKRSSWVKEPTRVTGKLGNPFARALDTYGSLIPLVGLIRSGVTVYPSNRLTFSLN